MRARGGSGPRAAPLRVFAATWLRRVEKPETRRSWPPDSGRDAGSAGAPRRPLSRSLGQRGGGDEAARGQQNNFDAQFDLTRSPRSPSPKPLSLPGSGGTAPERTSRAVGAPGRGIPCGPAGAPAPWLRLPRPPVCAPPRRPPPARRGAPRPALPSGPRAPPAGGVTPSATAGSVHGSNRKSLSPDHRQHRGLRGSQTCACSPSEAHMQTRAGKAGFLGLFQPCQMLAPADEPGQKPIL
ncbi:translation initiation factor IF-2-like isoform X2 [Camelus ferus]|uniref:Translation initiation factor IF-2-like isoform X2 n=1 Tax=Camelus ferus TaxID=419612 RepID=A0A8B8RPD8_CAMFR|nr:translation initiation factor IF-2-like isoform X2 [Camelus ferus]